MSNMKDKVFWLIDDSLPVTKLGKLPDEIKTGQRPFDYSLLRRMADLDPSEWAERPVHDTLKELLNCGAEVAAFLNPDSALFSLQNGARIPDLVIFDLKYETPRKLSISDVNERLDNLLQSYFTIIQIYTAEDTDQAKKEVGELFNKFPSRLPPPKNKANIDAGALKLILEQVLNRSLSAHLGAPVRATAAAAVERALVQLGELPLETALIDISAEYEDDASLVEEELVQMIAIKLTEALRNDTQFKPAVENAYKSIGGIPRENELVSMIVSQIRSHFSGERTIGNKIDAFIEYIRPRQKPIVNSQEQGADTEHETTLRRFHSYRLYDTLPCDRVQPGDVIDIVIKDGRQNAKELAMVLTPSCDLFDFWRKTGGCLTLVKLHSLTHSKELCKIRGKGKGLDTSSSLTAKEPFMIPSVPITADEMVDYYLFPRQTYHLQMKRADQEPAEFWITYSRILEDPQVESVKRIARISEPFLTGILNKIPEIVVRAGIPNMPKCEVARLKKLSENATPQSR